MEKGSSVGENAQSEEVKWIDEKYTSYMYILIGFLLLVIAPYAMTLEAGIFNNYILAINTVFSLFIMTMGLIEYLNITGKLNVLAKYYPIVMVVVGIATIFLYSHFYDTSWDQAYHLYIINITDAGPLHIAYYKARDTISEMSSVGGVVIVLGALYEILFRRVGKKAAH